MSDLMSFPRIIKEGQIFLDYAQEIKTIRSFTKGVQATDNWFKAYGDEAGDYSKPYADWSRQVEAFFDWGYACSQFWSLVEAVPLLVSGGVEAPYMMVAGVAVAGVSAFRSTCTDKPKEKWGLMEVSKGDMRYISLVKFGSSCLYKSLLLYQNFGKGSMFKTVRDTAIVAMLAMVFINTWFSAYQAGSPSDDKWESGFGRMFFRNAPIKPLKEDAPWWAHHVQVMTQTDLIRRYLGLVITVASFAAYREGRS